MSEAKTKTALERAQKEHNVAAHLLLLARVYRADGDMEAALDDLGAVPSHLNRALEALAEHHGLGQEAPTDRGAVVGVLLRYLTAAVAAVQSEIDRLGERDPEIVVHFDHKALGDLIGDIKPDAGEVELRRAEAEDG